MTNEADYTSRLGKYIQEKFDKATGRGINISLKEIGLAYCSNKAADWIYKGIGCRTNFYIENGELNLFFELTFPKDEGLIRRIQRNSESGNKIEKESIFLSRPHRITIEDCTINPHKIHYSVYCRIKKNLLQLEKLEEKNPKKLEAFFSDIWGHLMKVPIGLATGLIKDYSNSK